MIYDGIQSGISTPSSAAGLAIASLASLSDKGPNAASYLWQTSPEHYYGKPPLGCTVQSSYQCRKFILFHVLKFVDEEYYTGPICSGCLAYDFQQLLQIDF